MNLRPAHLLAAVALLVIAAYWPTLRSFHPVWLADPYTHGYLLAGVTGWLVWRRRYVLRPRNEGWKPALLGTAGLSLVWLAATIMGVQVVQQAALVPLLLCWTAAVFGFSAARALAPAAAMFLLAVPFWEVLSGPLQGMTVAATSLLLGVLQVPATIEGDIVTVGAGSFRVEDSCSGLSYLLASLALGMVYAHLSRARLPTRAGIVAIAAALSIVANWVRVTGVVVIGHVTRMQSPIVAKHGWFGWAIFLLSLPLFFVLARRLEQRAGAPPPRPSGVGPAGAESRVGPALRRAMAAGAAAVVGPLVYVSIDALPVASVASAAELTGGGAWRVVEDATRPFSWQPAYQGAHERSTLVLTDGRDQVFVDRLVYHGQSRGAELIQYGNRIADPASIVRDRIIGPLGDARRWMRQAVVRAPEGPVLVWYRYRVGGVDTPSPLWAKVLELAAFARRRERSELVAFSVPCAPDTCEAAHEVLSRFVRSRP